MAIGLTMVSVSTSERPFTRTGRAAIFTRPAIYSRLYIITRTGNHTDRQSVGDRRTDVDPQVEMVVARFGSMLASEDATLTIDSITDGVLKLRYSHGDGADCDTCVLT